MATIRIPISSLAGTGTCVAAADGQKVYSAISAAVDRGDRVILSFSGVTRITTAFLNAAVGQLYGEYSEAEIRMRLAPPVDVEPWQLARLQMVVERAKAFFQDEVKISELFSENSGSSDE